MMNEYFDANGVMQELNSKYARICRIPSAA